MLASTTLCLILAGLFAFAPQQVAAQDATPCHRVVEQSAESVMTIQFHRDCVALGDAQEMSGIWLSQHENFRFFEGATTLDDIRGDRRRVAFASDTDTRFPHDFRWEYGHAYRVRMIAMPAVRTTGEPVNGFGIFAMPDGLVVAAEVFEIEDLGRTGRYFEP